MADQTIELQGTGQRSEVTSEAPAVLSKIHWIRRLPTRVMLFQVAYVLVACSMLVNLLAINELEAWVKVVQAISGSACGLIGMAVGGFALLVSSLRAKVVSLALMYLCASISLGILDSQFAVALEGSSHVDFQLPSFYGILVIATTLPAMFKQEPVTLLIVGSMMNTVAFAFQVASYRSPNPLLSLVLFEVAVLAQAMKFSEAHKLNSVLDLSKTTTFAQHDDPVGSELEAILSRLQKVHSNAEEAMAAARTAEELQRASESEMLMRDLMTRMKTRNVYSILPERLTMNMSHEERTFIEENCLPPPAPKVRKCELAHSGECHVATDPLRYSLQELVPLLCQIGKQWNFDTDFLTGCSDNHPVSCVGDYLFRTSNLNKRLGLNADNVFTFFHRVEEGYLPNSYHSATHAADVMFSLHFLSKSSGLNFYSTDLEVAASIVATLGHDIGHLGFNNRFLVNSHHQLAIECNFHADNDFSVLEMMHASKTFQLAEETTAFLGLQGDGWILMRKQVIEMILATDMTRHFELLTQFRVTMTNLQLDESTTRLFLYKMLLKCADIGHAAKTTELHERWSLRVMDEFFNQGDAEKAAGLPVSMFCDRETTDVAKVRSTQSQRGFLENLAFPLFETVATALRCEVMTVTCVQQVTCNAVFWARKSRRRASTLQEKKFDAQPERIRLSAANLLSTVDPELSACV